MPKRSSTYWFAIGRFGSPLASRRTFQGIWGRVGGDTDYNVSAHNISMDGAYYVIVHGPKKRDVLSDVFERLIKKHGGHSVPPQDMDFRVLATLRARREHVMDMGGQNIEIQQHFEPGLPIVLDDGDEG